jgi:rfaE bifunctional protein kinase chain/domain
MAGDQDLKKTLQSFSNKKILIIGDVMVDEYLWGRVSRISPEAPVPVVSCDKREHRMGGAANVAVNIKAMGAVPVICSVIGRDEAGIIFKQLVGQGSMTDQGIVESARRRTTIKTRIIGNHQHLLRVDHEFTDFIDREEEDLLINRIREQIKNQTIDAIIFQDYDKGVITTRIIEEVTSLARAEEVPVLVDPKRRNFLAYIDVHVFKPNFKEFCEGLNIQLSKTDGEGIFRAARKMQKENSIGNMIITLSEKGIFVSDGSKYEVIPALERDIADVSGAGDTVIAVAALCLAGGQTVLRAAQLANLAGGLVCEKVGVVPVTPELFFSDNT